MVKVGRWGNTLVREDIAKEPEERRSAAAPNIEGPTKSDTRRLENQACVGGIRSPFRAVRTLPETRRVGAMVRAGIENFIDPDASTTKLTDLLGNGAAADDDSPERAVAGHSADGAEEVARGRPWVGPERQTGRIIRVLGRGAGAGIQHRGEGPGRRVHPARRDTSPCTCTCRCRAAGRRLLLPAGVELLGGDYFYLPVLSCLRRLLLPAGGERLGAATSTRRR
jgi:hypothetical protein